jgi:acetolactate synthase I/II/III large subunit
MVDMVNVMQPITKWAVALGSPKEMSRAAYHAVALAKEERPGAIHIEIPEDIAGMEHESKFLKHLPEPIRRPVPDEKAVRLAAEMIKSAKSPVIIVSSGGNRKLVTKQLKNLVDLTGLYVVGTQLGKGVLPDSDEHSLYSFGMHKKDYVNCAIDYSDLIITIGYNVNEHPPYVWNKDKNKKILHIDFAPAEPDEYYVPTMQVGGDISNTLWALQNHLKGVVFDTDYYQKVKKRLDEKYEEKIDSNSFPLAPQRIVNDVREVMAREDIVTLDNGIYKLWFARQYKTYSPNTLLLDNTLATMGAGLPSAMAAKLLNPEKRVLAVCGDGGFMMNSQELITCVKEKINVVTLILNDNAYGFIEWKQKNMNLPNYAMKLQNPNFVKYAESYGALGLRAESADELIPKLKEAFASNRPAVVECPIDYSDNNRVFNEELDGLVC